MSTLLFVLLEACRLKLGLEIMNAGAKKIQISLGSQTETIVPGLSFHATFPAPDESQRIFVKSPSCRYEYLLPNLDLQPWNSLIGDSVKFRWFDDGRLMAYPPTPDVKLKNNPQRASSDEVRTIRPSKASCH
ncbi:hypothetical protein [Sphingobium nicotianae]|uniref:Uncharacterized protein n=1 Tax=Sphingobium nicotianae TaxID=2782607 RepID=A0A9X1IT58_9SPHN|nr:hypothetical protein [Sphingobium nicotianae]MBT2188909.1 hypothetical protein [Sphingobium nicotianae]